MHVAVGPPCIHASHMSALVACIPAGLNQYQNTWGWACQAPWSPAFNSFFNTQACRMSCIHMHRMEHAHMYFQCIYNANTCPTPQYTTAACAVLPSHLSVTACTNEHASWDDYEPLAKAIPTLSLPACFVHMVCRLFPHLSTSFPQCPPHLIFQHQCI